MKVAPVSADLLIKLALAAAVIGVGVWAVRRTTQAISGAIPDVGGWIDDASSRIGVVASSLGTTVQDLANEWGRPGYAPPDQLPTLDNPWGIYLTDEQKHVQAEIAARPNPIYRGVSAVGAGLSGNSDWTLGTWIYDVFNPEPPPPDVGIGYGGIDARRIDRQLGY